MVLLGEGCRGGGGGPVAEFGDDAVAFGLQVVGIAMGVVDPTKVTRSALQNAASIAGLLLTTEAIVSELPDQERNAMPAPPGGMGY